jgi:hypothetical protein
MSAAIPSVEGAPRPPRHRKARHMAAADREKALDVALANIEKQFGKGR